MLPQSQNPDRKQQPSSTSISLYIYNPSFMLPALQGPWELMERW